MRDKPSSNQFSNEDCQVRGNGIHSVLQVLVQLGTVVWRQKVLKVSNLARIRSLENGFIRFWSDV